MQTQLPVEPAASLQERIRILLAEQSPQQFHSLANRLGVDRALILAALLSLERSGYLKLNLLIYHLCFGNEFLVIYKGGFRSGLPLPPLSCMECEVEYFNYEELAFDLEAVAEGHQVEVEL